MQKAFENYVLAALSEVGDIGQDHTKIYIEAIFHLEKASKLLEGLPHPAGKMSYRLDTMMNTLNKVMEGQDNFAAQRAARFMEKNLVRRLKDIWLSNTSTPFHSGGDGTGKNPRDFILCCFRAAGKHIPELPWFTQVNFAVADQLIKSIKR